MRGIAVIVAVVILFSRRASDKISRSYFLKQNLEIFLIAYLSSMFFLTISGEEFSS